jgi:hypothetical protein
MTTGIRWHNADNLPEDVQAAMRDMLSEGLREAARMSDPGDGSMVMLLGDRMLGKGMWDGGWKIQASFVEDERMNPKPFVVVHAYQDSCSTKGSVASDVERTADDRRFIAQARLDAMVLYRDSLTHDIEKLTRQLELESL